MALLDTKPTVSDPDRGRVGCLTTLVLEAFLLLTVVSLLGGPRGMYNRVLGAVLEQLRGLAAPLGNPAGPGHF